MSRFTLGLDLGMKRDYTALAAIEPWRAPAGRDPVTWQSLWTEGVALRGLERMRLGLGYLAVPQWIRSLLRRWNIASSTLVVDATGVGAPVVELLRRENLPCTIIPVTITASGVAHTANSEWHVSRHELLTRLALGLESNRIQIAAGLQESAALREEMLSLRPGRNAHHDDLTLAFALAWWWSERRGRPINGTRPLGLEY
jgi:hypothetical protein